jgi:hypothetical protein
MHSTGMGGPVNDTMRGPDGVAAVLVLVGDEVGETVVGSDVVLVVDEGEAAVDGVVVVGDGGLEESLLHAGMRRTAAMVASEASRRRRTHRSYGERAVRTGAVRILFRCPASSTWRSAT